MKKSFSYKKKNLKKIKFQKRLKEQTLLALFIASLSLIYIGADPLLRAHHELCKEQPGLSNKKEEPADLPCPVYYCYGNPEHV